MPSDMIERVARALCEENSETPNAPHSITREPRWMSYVGEARAAIDAMREPTEAMLSAPDKILDSPSGHKFIVRADREVWQAMIDEALK